MVIWPKKNSKMGAAAGSRRKSSPPWEVERGLRAGPSDGARPLPMAPGGPRGLPAAPEGSRRLPRAPGGPGDAGSRAARGLRGCRGGRPFSERPRLVTASSLSCPLRPFVWFCLSADGRRPGSTPTLPAGQRGGAGDQPWAPAAAAPHPAPASPRERRAGPLRVWGPVSHSAARTGAAPRPAMLRSPHGDSPGPRRRHPHRRGAAVSVARAAPSAGRRSAFRPTCGRRPFLCERIFAPETLGAASITDRGHPRSRRPSPPPAAAPEDPTQVAVPAP